MDYEFIDIIMLMLYVKVFEREMYFRGNNWKKNFISESNFLLIYFELIKNVIVECKRYKCGFMFCCELCI